MTKILTRTLLGLLAVAIAVYLLMPVLVIIPMSWSESPYLAFPPEGFTTQWYERFFSDMAWMSALGNSLTVGLLSALLSVVLGTLAALALVRGRFPFRGLIMGVLLAPMIVPFVIVGLAVYITFLSLGLTQTTLGFVLVHTCLGVPYVMINVVASLSSVDRRLEMAAMNLGAGPVETFFRITLPLIFPGMFAGALFAFITSWDEVVVAIFLSGPEITTLPVKMWSGIRVQIDPTIAAISTLSLVVILAAFGCQGLVKMFSSASERRRRKRIAQLQEEVA
ncbi:ABC transporter permease [Leucobacter tenebrionis]|uniref:ABC transporter permease n=1 Tax=Leucobacter tenebrionis TaxID=2873270 RepID=UPI001CA6D5E3|nr:ABC transporter permease [Leucobacter tenebrionis]QZY52671.1 ABC transporter permease [Leucobacter tenebrionis]